MRNAEKTLVLGGARSGKSRYGESLARQTGLKRIYLATAPACDEEMHQRIAQHKQDRANDGWHTIEEEIALAEKLLAVSRSDTVILVDCLTLWLSNLMFAEMDPAEKCHDLQKALRVCPGPVVFVSNEVGMGLVPETALGRQFRDAQGRLNQSLAKTCESVIFVAAGLPLVLKGVSAQTHRTASET